MLDSRTASFTRSDEGYFGCGYAASFHHVGNAPRVQATRNCVSTHDARGVAHAVKRVCSDRARNQNRALRWER